MALGYANARPEKYRSYLIRVPRISNSPKSSMKQDKTVPPDEEILSQLK